MPRQRLSTRVAELTKELEEQKSAYAALEKRLEEKERIIRNRESKIAALESQVASLKEKIVKLEKKLKEPVVLSKKSDEEEFENITAAEALVELRKRGLW